MKKKLWITPDGIAFSKFRGYEKQQSVAPGWTTVMRAQTRRQS
jgi:hypothetical protein